jgi:hypothetical protein
MEHDGLVIILLTRPANVLSPPGIETNHPTEACSVLDPRE